MSYTLTFDKITITPAIAASLLDSSTGNRHISWTEVDRLSKEIEAGRWGESHQPIALVNDGLIDGQHRCHAIRKANRAVVSSIAYYCGDVPENILSGIDDVRKRSVSDRMKIADPDTEATAARIAIAKQMLIPPDVSNNASLGYIEIVDCFHKYENVIIHVDVRLGNARKLGTSTVKSMLVRARVGFLVRQEMDEIDDFIEVFKTGVCPDESKTAPIRLRDMLLAGVRLTKSERDKGLSINVKTKFLIQSAIVKFCSKQPVTTLRMLQGNVYQIDEDLEDLDDVF